jgi:hypothetical protein
VATFRHFFRVPDSFSTTSLRYFLIGAGLRIICFFFSSNNGGDAIARAEGTAAWLRHMDWRPDAFGPYLPLHFWLMAIPSELTGNVLLGTRLLSQTLGILSLYLIWLATNELFGGTAANYSLILYAFYSLHVGYSATSSSEVPYLSFLLGALILFFRYRRTRSLRYLALCAVTLACAAAIRYEAWVLILGFGLALLWPLTRILQKDFWTKAELMPISLFTALAGAWPVTFMAYCWLKFRDPVHYFLTAQKMWMAEVGTFIKDSVLYIFAFNPGVMVIALSPVGVAVILYGIWVARHQGPPVQDYFIIMVSFACVQFYDIVSGGTWPSARFTLTLGTLLTLSGGHGIASVLSKVPVPRRAVASSIFIGALAMNLCLVLFLSEIKWRFTDKFRSVSPFLEFPTHVDEVSEFLKPRIGSKDSIIIDNYNQESNIVARALNLPLVQSRAFLASERMNPFPLSSSSAEIAAERKGLYQFVENQHPRYLIYYDLGSLRPYLPLGGCPNFPRILNGAEFRCLYSGTVYRIYGVTYQTR